MTAFVLKIIACVSMIIDHTRYVIPNLPNDINFFLLCLGRIAFPIFAFLISEGYTHTSNLEKYMKRLIIFAIISQVPFMLFRTLVGEWIMLNIMFTLLLGLAGIVAYDKLEKKYSIPFCILVVFLGNIFRVDYGWKGVLLVILFYVLKNSKKAKCAGYFLFLLIWIYLDRIFFIFNVKLSIMYFGSYILSLICILFYNGKQGKKIKYFLYGFYPVHMLILYAISLIT